MNGEGFSIHFNFKMLYFGVNHVLDSIFFSHLFFYALSSKCPPLSKPTEQWMISMENLKWCCLSKLNQHLSPSIFLFVETALYRDKVVVDDGRYKTSSPVCISFNSIRMRVHEHYTQKWLNICVWMDFCYAMEFLKRKKRREKNVCDLVFTGFDKNSQSTVCD